MREIFIRVRHKVKKVFVIDLIAKKSIGVKGIITKRLFIIYRMDSVVCASLSELVLTSKSEGPAKQQLAQSRNVS